MFVRVGRGVTGAKALAAALGAACLLWPAAASADPLGAVEQGAAQTAAAVTPAAAQAPDTPAPKPTDAVETSVQPVAQAPAATTPEPPAQVATHAIGTAKQASESAGQTAASATAGVERQRDAVPATIETARTELARTSEA